MIIKLYVVSKSAFENCWAMGSELVTFLCCASSIESLGVESLYVNVLEFNYIFLCEILK